MFINRKKLATTAAIVFGVALFVFPVLAQTDLGLDYATSTGLGTTDIRTIIGNIVNYFLGLLGIVAVLLILYAGFLWMTAQGNEEQVSRAKRVMTQAVIGLIIIMSAFAIAQFILRAIISGTGLEGGVGPGGGRCPPGEVCGIPGAGSGGFKVSGVVPVGSGPGDSGWPKNYAITVAFSHEVAAATVSGTSFVVERCNSRLSGGDPAPFNERACDTIVSGNRTVEANRVIFRPKDTPGDHPTDFEEDYWYRVRVLGGDVTDVRGRILVCPFLPPGPDGDISSPRALSSLCDRAMAFNNLRDVEPPTIRIDSPASTPAYCLDRIRVRARVLDDFLPSRVDFMLDGGLAHLTDADGEPLFSTINAALENPFLSDSVFIDSSSLADGEHILSAVGYDGVPQASEAIDKKFRINPAHCCNGELDAELGEERIDCGVDSGCGACGGDACRVHADCATGFCDPESGRCKERPTILDVSPLRAGPGTLVTISGRFFGGTMGQVIFLGGDTDGDGEVAGDDDDKSMVACSPWSWSDNEVVIAIPEGVVTGPLQLVTSSGTSDRTDDEFEPMIGAFIVNDEVLPGICYLEPATGSAGDGFIAHGAGFGDAMGASLIRMGGVNADVTGGGWTASAVSAVVPAVLPEGVYQVSVMVGGLDGITTNQLDFTLRRRDDDVGPRIIEILPSSGPVDSYITLRGSGFGRRKGLVRFISSPDGVDTAIAVDPICDDNWHDNYIVVKVPENYIGDLPVSRILHRIEVETAAPAQVSNRVDFLVDDSPIAPGMCSITPNNGKPGIPVTVSGEGFGPGPANIDTPGFAGFDARQPENSLRFYVSGAAAAPGLMDGLVTKPGAAYLGWTRTSIRSAIPGNPADRNTWPNSGPVFAVARNVATRNPIPFKVGDCNDDGICEEGTTCCANGSCRESCEPEARDSKFGWIFSTDVLPTLPIVVQRASCSLEAGTIQSPTPQQRATDACRNALAAVEFSLLMNIDSLNDPESLLIEECGSGRDIDCPKEPSFVPIARPVETDLTADGAATILSIHPSLAYPPDDPDDAEDEPFTGYFKPNTWYRITLVSDPVTEVGIIDATGRYLDGDYDRRAGGNFVWTFKTRADRAACAADNVMVLPSRYTISHQGPSADPTNGFNAALMRIANCNRLQCVRRVGFDLRWSSDPGVFISLLGDGGVGCRQMTTGRLETPVDAPERLIASLRPAGELLERRGISMVSVAFADPRVVRTMPTEGCTEACVNAKIGAVFNIPMSARSFAGNVEFFQCRNASCNPPYIPIGFSVESIRDDGARVLPPGDPDAALQARIVLGPGLMLLPNTFYKVRIRGGADGVLSTSDVPLTGLNVPGFYEWKFRTKTDGSVCEISRAEIIPPSATLRYVSERLGLNVGAYGPADECSPDGQELDAWGYDWDWSIDPNPVLTGFIRAREVGSETGMDVRVDTNPVPRRGCDSQCLLIGSTDVVSQCGNTDPDDPRPARDRAERGEDCDDGGLRPDDGCSPSCLAEGSAPPNCGNGLFDPGEMCEALPDAEGISVFLLGCKDPNINIEDRPELNGIGCIFLGSTAGRSVCGDGFLGDGEACEDGNRRDGDGCSADCLNEGTLPICTIATPEDEPCVSQCGNARIEPGEDPDCDLAGGVALGCDLHSCTKTGSVLPADCSNNILDPGEECDDNNTDNGDGCSSRCLFEGSSAFYRTTSFCGDGFSGPGEHPFCDNDEVEPDERIDKRQITVAGDYDETVGVATTSVVHTSIDRLPERSRGTSRVTLSCNCSSQVNPDEYCSGLLAGVPAGLRPLAGLACADSGCCAPRPHGELTYPAEGSVGICRNTAIHLGFDQPMNSTSITQNLLIGVDSGAVGCPVGLDGLPDESGVIEVPPFPPAPLGIMAAGRVGLLHRAWSTVAAFFSDLFGRPVLGHAIGVPHTHFCSVTGDITVRLTEEGRTEVEFKLDHALPAGTRVRVRVQPDARTVGGVRVAPAGLTAEFTTGDLICAIDQVIVSPAEVLLNHVQTLDKPLVARGVSSDRGIRLDGEAVSLIVPTREYSWSWEWLPLSERPPHVSPAVLNPITVGGRQSEQATVRVRGRETSDDPVGYVPQDGVVDVLVNAVTVNPDGSTSLLPLLDDHTRLPIPGGFVLPGNSKVTVALCDVIWPEVQICGDDGRLHLPWDPDNILNPLHGEDCTAGVEKFWYPFVDPATKASFYYCRDSSGGDGDDLLPAINDDFVLVSPGGDIEHEYLFTFAGAGADDAWRNDAIGFRVMKNPKHLGVIDWYRDRGFTGAPAPFSVDGYDALKEGRTVYANSAKMSDGRQLETIINVFSFSDGAAPETITVFNQLMDRIDFNRQPELVDTFICLHEGRAVLDVDGRAITCSSDSDCGVDDTCNVSKSKLVRDVRRWSDLHTMRSLLMANRPLPTLGEGTYIRSRTYSIWPSWGDVLSSAVGRTIPSDPLNILTSCPDDGFDRETCWNSVSRQFSCGARSSIYRYQILAGQADLSVDMEYVGGGWIGSTCIEIRESEICGRTPGCVWNGVPPAGSCNYETVRFRAYGVNAGADMCIGESESEEVGCGNGIINPGEVCELGDLRTEPGADGVCVGGTVEQACTADCRGWEVVPGTCRIGYCGDGRRQGAEICDDGPLNGTYGHCNGICSGSTFFCGDGAPHPSELCDCRDLNGRYAINAVIASSGGIRGCGVGEDRTGANFATCSWDCRGSAPHCGDGIVNGAEQCDGGSEESRGVCRRPVDVDPLHPSGRTCSADADCNLAGGERCVTCPTVEQRFHRACNPNNVASIEDDRDGAPNQSCNWSAWSCTAPGRCGNGVTETGEQCDDGNDEDNDACTSACVNNICGDGFVNAAGGEMCDSSERNNEPCVPEYGHTCNYCTSACRLGTVSGGYCGDGERQNATSSPPGPEQCDTHGAPIGDGWVCVSTRPKDRSFGVQTGYGICSLSGCNYSCADRDSELCHYVASSNFDILWSSSENRESCEMVSYDVLREAPPIGDRRPGSAPRSLFEFCLDRQHWATDGLAETPLTWLPNECDPDDDNDGVPDELDCGSLDPSIRPEYRIPGTTLVVPVGEQLCEDDGNCNGDFDDLPPYLHRKIDMVFVIDVTGSMNSIIDSLIESLNHFVARFSGERGRDLRFGYVTVGQPEVKTLNMMKSYSDGGDRMDEYMFFQLGSVGDFNSHLEGTRDNCWTPDRRTTRCEIDKGGKEPLYAAAYALMRPGMVSCSPEDGCDPRIEREWDYDIAWRDDAQPYVVIVSDEPPPIGTYGAPEDLLASIQLDDVTAAAKHCTLTGCSDGGYVEMFVISKNDYKPLWLPALPSTDDGTGSQLTAEQRYISFDLDEHGAVVEDATPGLNSNALYESIFQYICGAS